MLNRREIRAGVILGNVDHQSGEYDADQGRAEHGHAHFSRHHGPRHDRKTGHRQAGRVPQAGVQRRHDFLARLCLDHRTADDRCEDGNGAQHQRIQHRLRFKALDYERTQQHRGNQRDDISFKQVRRHAGAIANIVADVIGNDGRIARIIFGNAGFDLADQIGTNVGALCENAAAKAGKNRNQRSAEREADEGFQQVMLRDAVADAGCTEVPVKQRHAQQAQAYHEHAGDRATLEGDIERFVHAFGGCLRGAHVRAH